MIIYKITCLGNSKVYIGQTIRTFAQRKGLHVFQLRNNIHPNSYLQNSYNKYGEDSIVFERLTTARDIDELNRLEIEYIQSLKTHISEEGFNVRYGGENCELSDEHKAKISVALVGNTNGSGKSKKVYQYDLAGNLIKTWDKAMDIVREWNLSSSSPVSRCCLGIRNHYKGYKWSYEMLSDENKTDERVKK